MRAEREWKGEKVIMGRLPPVADVGCERSSLRFGLGCLALAGVCCRVEWLAGQLDAVLAGALGLQQGLIGGI